MTEPDHDAAARGCLNGVLGGVVFWLFVIAVIIAVTLTVR